MPSTLHDLLAMPTVGPDALLPGCQRILIVPNGWSGRLLPPLPTDGEPTELIDTLHEVLAKTGQNHIGRRWFFRVELPIFFRIIKPGEPIPAYEAIGERDWCEVGPEYVSRQLDVIGLCERCLWPAMRATPPLGGQPGHSYCERHDPVYGPIDQSTTDFAALAAEDPELPQPVYLDARKDA